MLKFLFIFFLFFSPCYAAELSYTTEEIIEYYVDNVPSTKEGVIENIQPQSSKPIKTVFKYYSNIYLNDNLIAENVETNKVVGGKLTCQAFITEWNKTQGKVSVADVENIKVTAK